MRLPTFRTAVKAVTATTLAAKGTKHLYETHQRNIAWSEGQHERTEARSRSIEIASQEARHNTQTKKSRHQAQQKPWNA